VSQLLEEACGGREADHCKIILALLLHLQSRYATAQPSTFCMRPDTAKVKGKILVKQPVFTTFFKQLIWEAGGLVLCSLLKALLTWAVSQILNINMVA